MLFFSVARHVGCLKLGSKHALLYVRLSIMPLSQQRQGGNYKALSISFRGTASDFYTKEC